MAAQKREAQRKGRKALSCFKYIMIFYTDSGDFRREYLSQWFMEDTLVFTDSDIEDQDATALIQTDIPRKYTVVDISHNPIPEAIIRLERDVLLTNNFEYYYNPQPGFCYFPFFLLMHSLRANFVSPYSIFSFDAGYKKFKPVMCLNSTPQPHRTLLWKLLNEKSVIDKIEYSFIEPHDNTVYPWPYPIKLESEKGGFNQKQIGVEHPVYGDCAVNVVTETTVERGFISEKTCKPFEARQIPVLVGPIGLNQVLVDFGLDMFEDIVPWRTWDSEVDHNIRVEKIANFVAQWIESDSILDCYKSLLPRIERNKQYFHSDVFRERIMIQMQRFNPAF